MQHEPKEAFVTVRAAGVVPNVPDVVTFNSLETFEKMHQIFETVKEAGMGPNGVTFGNLIDACTAGMVLTG